MWWVSFVSGCVVGAVAAVMLFALVICAEDEKDGRR